MASAVIRDRLQSGAQASTSSSDGLALLKRRFPCREQAIGQLADEFSRGGSVGKDCLVYGPPATGKTAVVRCAALPPYFVFPLWRTAWRSVSLCCMPLR